MNLRKSTYECQSCEEDFIILQRLDSSNTVQSCPFCGMDDLIKIEDPVEGEDG
ncbi:MAG: hypothetical protein KAS32_23655 [Candidatus Peribacteraceae bacterium]|nr:hypothetical protein [Candidatus Peribacteraceae bacterium]